MIKNSIGLKDYPLLPVWDPWKGFMQPFLSVFCVMLSWKQASSSWEWAPSATSLNVVGEAGAGKETRNGSLSASQLPQNSP